MKTNKVFKITVVVTILLLLVGTIMLSLIGYNQTVDYKDHYTMSVSVSNGSLQNKDKIAKDAVDDYLNQNGIKFQSFEEKGSTLLVYNFESANEIKKIDKESVKTCIEEAWAKASALVTSIDVNFNEVVVSSRTASIVGKVCLALGISLVAIFVYLFFMEKWQSALTVIIISILSGLIFAMLMGITRVPADPFGFASLVLASLFGTVLSAGLVSRYKENANNVANAKLTSLEIAKKSLKDSVLRYSIVAIFTLCFAIPFMCLGPTYIRFLGLQILLAGISGMVVSIFWTNIIWAFFKKFKSKKQNKQAIQKQ